MSTFASLIKEKRLQNKMSLRSASSLIGISYTYLSNLENDYDKSTGTSNKPTPETLQMIAKAYKLDYNFLLQLCGYITERDLNLNPKLQELVARCRTLSEDDIDRVIDFTDYVLWSQRDISP